MKLNIEDIVIREKLYPRKRTDPVRVHQYAGCIELLPPIEVNQDNILIDGRHRLKAHTLAGLGEIETTITETKNEREILKLAAERNKRGNVPLEEPDKKKSAEELFKMSSDEEKKNIVKEFVEVLSVPRRTAFEWRDEFDEKIDDNRLKNERDEKVKEVKQRQERIKEKVKTRSQKEVAEEEGVSEAYVSKISNELTECSTALSEFTNEDFDIPIYDEWRYARITNRMKHPGNTEQTIVENLMYLFTEPDDLVVDYFAGGGSTADIAYRRGRKCFMSDINPIDKDEIVKHDITTGLPDGINWNEVSLVYLDPPYSRTADHDKFAEQYTDSPTNLANMEIPQFEETMANVIKQTAEQMREGTHIALVCAPTTRYPDMATGKYNDHTYEIRKLVEPLEVVNVIAIPYQTQLVTRFVVGHAKKQKKIIALRRDLIVWRVDN